MWQACDLKWLNNWSSANSDLLLKFHNPAVADNIRICWLSNFWSKIFYLKQLLQHKLQRSWQTGDWGVGGIQLQKEVLKCWPKQNFSNKHARLPCQQAFGRQRSIEDRTESPSSTRPRGFRFPHKPESNRWFQLNKPYYYHQLIPKLHSRWPCKTQETNKSFREPKST